MGRHSKLPLIGITADIDETRKERVKIFTYLSYSHCLKTSRAIGLILAPQTPLIPHYQTLFDGLLLTGGDDVHPKFFGQTKASEKVKLSSKTRTDFEITLARSFLSAGKPVLGICLGIQTLNVALGGSLIQDLGEEVPAWAEHKRGSHKILLEPKSQLSKILRQTKFSVHSRHHQAVACLGDGLRMAGTCPDGVIEAIESTRHPFALGVQWHPEETPHRISSRRLFNAFVTACRKRA